MSYNPAYTAQFYGTDGTLWSVEISIFNYGEREIEIRLEYDEPLVIEWQETKKTDVVQSSTCTLKVSNERDRQMLALMTNTNAICSVYRGNALYWRGRMDDCVYEEPYSFKNGYVTELTFSDFGFLNRTQFSMTGRHSLREIVDDCLETAQLASLPVMQMVSLVSPKMVQVLLEMLFVSCDRFNTSDNWQNKREVLEDVLRPLGLRIIQKNGKIWVYDIEHLRDVGNATPVIWKGTDAVLSGADTYGIFKIAFDSDPEETIIDGSIDSNRWNYVSSDRYWADYREEDGAIREVGFYFEYGGTVAGMSSEARVFKIRGYLSGSEEYGYARRAWCYDSVNFATRNLLETTTPRAHNTVSELLRFQSGYLPLIPNRDNFQLRVNLDFLFSIKYNPFEDAEDWNIPIDYTSWSPYYWIYNTPWENWQKQMLRLYIPVKLEIVDENGNVLYHYKNTSTLSGTLRTLDPLKGQWVQGAAGWIDMFLSYYKEGLDETALDGWATNKQTISCDRDKIPGIFKKRKDGEYVPLPPVPGYVRFSVSNGLTGLDIVENQMLLNFDQDIHWQLYRKPQVTVVRSNMVNDDLSKDDIKEEDWIDMFSDTLTEDVKIGAYRNGVAPCARGLLSDIYGLVWSKFVKNGTLRTLEEHRMRSLQDQTVLVQPKLSGTAELNAEFGARSDSCTSGKFLVIAQRQDARSATEQITMVRIAGIGGFVYEYSWSNPICVKEEECYTFEWSDPVCVKTRTETPVTPPGPEEQ